MYHHHNTNKITRSAPHSIPPHRTETTAETHARVLRELAAESTKREHLEEQIRDLEQEAENWTAKYDSVAAKKDEEIESLKTQNEDNAAARAEEMGKLAGELEGVRAEVERFRAEAEDTKK